MHPISSLKKRCLGPTIVSAAASGEAPSVLVAKKPIAKEMLEAQILAGIEQTRKRWGLAASSSGGGNESNNHGSEDGVPPEVVVKDARGADPEANRIALEEKYREREMEQLEEEGT